MIKMKLNFIQKQRKQLLNQHILFNTPTIAIGRPPFNKKINGSLNKYTLDNKKHRWGYDNGLIFKDARLNRPYNGIVSSFKKGSDKYIVAYGNEIEGTVAAVKKLISARDILFDNYPTTFNIPIILLDDYDTLAISVFDLMHNNESNAYYRQNNENFKKVVERILTDNNYELSIKLVTTINDNTTLRMKHSNSDFTGNYQDAITNTSNPVVLSRGLHSNLFTWDNFGEKLAQQGFDTWIIEAYGGPTTECDTCPAYTFTNLTDQHWPALISGVQQYSGQSDLSYVGYDLGCTMALESLEDYNSGKNNAGRYLDTNGQWQLMDLSSTPITNFIGIACLGNFTRVQTDKDSSQLHGSDSIELLNESWDHMKTELQSNIDGFDLKEYYYRQKLQNPFYTVERLRNIYEILTGKSGEGLFRLNLITLILKEAPNFFNDNFEYKGNKISTNVYDTLVIWFRDPTEPKIGEGVSLDRFAIIQSENTPRFFGLISEDLNTDDFVSDKDQLEICKNIVSDNKQYLGFKNYNHFNTDYMEQFEGNSLADVGPIKDVVVRLLNEEDISGGEGFEIISNDPDCIVS